LNTQATHPSDRPLNHDMDENDAPTIHAKEKELNAQLDHHADNLA
jgi:hypothetical protein